MKKLSLIMAVLMAIGLFAGCAQQENAEQLPGDEEAPAKEYQYITADEVKTMIENGDEKVIVDIQPEEYYAQGHLPTAISTYAYPADTDELKAKLDTALEKIDEKEGPVIIVGLGGKTGAENAYDYYAEKGVDESRLRILEGGQMSWPYEELKWYNIDYLYIAPDDLVKLLEENKNVMLIDIRQSEYYDAGHLPGSIPTYSFPNTNKEQWDALDELNEQIEKTLDPIVLICMSGTNGAYNAGNVETLGGCAGGTVGLNLYPPFLGGRADFDTLRAHLEHMLTLCGEDHVALGGDLDGLLDRHGDLRLDHRLAQRFAQLLEKLAVLGTFDRLERGAQNLDLTLFQNALLGELHREVQTRLPAQSRHDGVGAFEADDLGDVFERQRLHVYLVRNMRVGHDRGGVRIHENHLVALFLECEAGLRARIVEFGGLSDDDRTRTDNHYLLYISSLRHFYAPPLFW